MELPTPSSEDLHIEIPFHAGDILHVQLPSFDGVLHEGSDLSQYQQDRNDVNNTLGQVQTNSDDCDQQLRNHLTSLLRQIQSQSQLIMTTASCLKDSECSRSLLEKEVNHLLGAVRSLSTRLRSRTQTGNDAEVATLLEEKIALKSEVIRYKELAGELQLGFARLKARYNAEKKANEENIQLLFEDVAAKNQRIQQLGEWQIWLQEAMRRRDDAKDDEIQQLRLHLEID